MQVERAGEDYSSISSVGAPILFRLTWLSGVFHPVIDSDLPRPARNQIMKNLDANGAKSNEVQRTLI